MADHGGGDEKWKCKKHPSRGRGGGGVCYICVRERLLRLCPNCAKDVPCSCPSAYANARLSSSSSSSYSSSYSYSSSSAVSHLSCAAIGGVGRMGNLIDQEPPFRRNPAFPWSLLKRDTHVNGSAGRRSFSTAGRRSQSAEEGSGEEVRSFIRSRSVGGERVWYLFSRMKVFRRIKSKNTAACGGAELRLPVLS